jgi:hypothetical protein
MREPLAAIMRHMADLCTSGERARAGVPTGWIGVTPLAVQRAWFNPPRWPLIGAHGRVDYGPDRIRSKPKRRGAHNRATAWTDSALVEVNRRHQSETRTEGGDLRRRIPVGIADAGWSSRL